MHSPRLHGENGSEMRKEFTRSAVVLVLLCLTAAGCARRQPPLAQPAPPAAPPPVAAAPAPAPRAAAPEALPVPPEPVAIAEDGISARSLDELNRDSPFEPAFFPLDSAELDEEGRAVVTMNAGIMRKYPTWTITVEGHCDERGTAEYNLALGERRAVAVKTYLVSLGIAADRVRTVSYGKEFPFDPGHDEEAWASNRRAQFVITSK
jgi:peptidoglycan-associated lipoprotein